MRSKAMSLSAVFVLVASATACADNASVKRELIAGFNKRVAQYRAKDIRGFMTMYASDFKGMNPGGRPTSKKQIERDMGQAMKDTKSLDSASISIDKLTTKGLKANVESTMTLNIHVVDSVGELGVRGKIHTLTIVERARELWVKTKAGWQVKTSTPLPGDKMIVDGKSFPSAPPPRPKSNKR